MLKGWSPICVQKTWEASSVVRGSQVCGSGLLSRAESILLVEVPTEQSLVPPSLEKGWRHANAELFSRP